MKNARFEILVASFAVCLSPALVRADEPAAKAAPSQFEAMDADQDGRISASEHAAATKQMFVTMDANADGRVTAAEMDAAHEKITGSKGTKKDMSSAEKIKVIDTDGDGVLTAAEHDAGSQSMFDKMDIDKDGYLTRTEWTVGHAALTKKPAK